MRRPFEEWTSFLSTLFIRETVGRCRDPWMKLVFNLYRLEDLFFPFFFFFYGGFFKSFFSKVISKVEM